MDFVGTFSAMALVIGQCVNVVNQGIITEILVQFLIFEIRKCVSVIILHYMHVPYGGGGAKYSLMGYFPGGLTRG